MEVLEKLRRLLILLRALCLDERLDLARYLILPADEAIEEVRPGGSLFPLPARLLGGTALSLLTIPRLSPFLRGRQQLADGAPTWSSVWPRSVLPAETLENPSADERFVALG